MIFTETNLGGAYVLDVEPAFDERGYFARTMCSAEFAQHGLVGRFLQASESYNRRRGTLRGMHFQTGEAAEPRARLPSAARQPPATSTWPEGNSVAVCQVRAVARLAVGLPLHSPVAGSYTSVLARDAKPGSWPPAASTLPEGNSVAVWPP